MIWSYIWNISYIDLRMWNQVSYDPRSYERNLCKCVYRSLKNSGLQWGDLAIPVQRSNQLSYEDTDVGSWSFVGSKEPVKNECEVIYETFHILNCEDHSLLDFTSAVQYRIIAYLISHQQVNIWNVSYITSHSFLMGSLEGSNPIEVLNFSGFYIRNCINCIHNCEDHSFCTWVIMIIKLIKRNHIKIIYIGLQWKG